MTKAETFFDSIVEFLEVGSIATGHERAIVAAEFMREVLDVSMVRVVIDEGSECLSASSTTIDRSVPQSVWEQLTEDDLMVIRATGGRRDLVLPNGHRGFCTRERNARVSMTIAAIGEGGEPLASSFSTTVLRTALALWDLGDKVIRLQADVNRLSVALESRVVIEQAKGVLAERWSVEPAMAFARLRKSARDSGSTLTATAAEVVRSTGAGRAVHR